MNEHTFDIPLSSGLKPEGLNTFPLLRAKDVDVDGERLTKFIPIVLSQAQYDIIYEGREEEAEITLENGQVIKYDPEQVYFIKSELVL